MFPPAARRALSAGPGGDGHAGGAAGAGDAGATGTLPVLHRICRVYAVVGVVVPVFGFATANRMGVLGSAWLIVSIALTALAALVLVALVLPAQTALLEGDAGPGRTARLAMATGLFNLLWASVTVLMIVRPGSTTGA
ncbi:membrane protein [Streptomyces libani subsp. rufus]|nr:membrane protein [Streptomyces libani subsp. rufus]